MCLICVSYLHINKLKSLKSVKNLTYLALTLDLRLFGVDFYLVIVFILHKLMLGNP